MTRACTITLTVTAPSMGAVRDWLREQGAKPPRDPYAALFAYACCVLLSNSDWDGVPLRVALVTGAAESPGGAG